MEYKFSMKQKNSYICLRWHILRSYHFVVEVTFNVVVGLYAKISMLKAPWKDFSKTKGVLLDEISVCVWVVVKLGLGKRNNNQCFLLLLLL